MNLLFVRNIPLSCLPLLRLSWLGSHTTHMQFTATRVAVTNLVYTPLVLIIANIK